MKVALTIAAREKWADAVAKLGVRAVCVSYPSLKRRSPEFCERFLGTMKDSGAWILLDSGARNFEAVDDEEAETWMRGYLEFVEEHHSRIAAWTELDAADVVGIDKIMEWRRAWEDNKLQHGLVVGYLSDDDLDGRYGMVGVPQGESAEFYDQLWSRNIVSLKRNKVLLFGRGATSARALRQPWFCVDSTTWTSWGRWGHLFFWDDTNRKLDVLKRPGGNDQEQIAARLAEFDHRDIWGEADDLGLSEGLRNLEQDACDVWNMAQWVKLQAHMETAQRGAYWLSQEEKEALAAESNRPVGELVVLSQYANQIQGRQRRIVPRSLQVGRMCNTCALSDKCPMFEADTACALSELQPIETKQDVVEAVQLLLAQEFDRVQFAMLEERLNGGRLDDKVSAELSKFYSHLKSLRDLSTTRERITVESSSQGSNGGGIISKFFGSILEKEGVDPAPDREVIDVAADGQ